MAPAALRVYTEVVQPEGATLAVTVPATVVPGDTMVMYVTRGPSASASVNATHTISNGWSLLSSATNGSSTTAQAGLAFTKTATAADPGSVVTIGTTASTGIVHTAVFTAWTGPIRSAQVVNSAGSSSAGNSTIVTNNQPTANQITGDSIMVLGSIRVNAANGVVGLTFPTAYSFSQAPVTAFWPGGTQTMQSFLAVGTIPASGKTSTLTTAAAGVYINSRTSLSVVFAPSLNIAPPLRAEATLAATGTKEAVGQGEIHAFVTTTGLAQEPPERVGTLLAEAFMEATGALTASAQGAPLDAVAHLAGTGEVAQPPSADGSGSVLAVVLLSGEGEPVPTFTGTGGLQAVVLLSGEGEPVPTAAGTGDLRVVTTLAGHGLNADNAQVASGAGSLTVTAQVQAEGRVLSETHDLEILYSTQGVSMKGVTLAPSLTFVLAGTPIAIDTVDGYGYPYEPGGPDGRDRPIGVLRRTVQGTDLEEPVNVVIGGLLRLESLSRHTVNALVDKRNAAVSIGKSVVRF